MAAILRSFRNLFPRGIAVRGKVMSFGFLRITAIATIGSLIAVTAISGHAQMPMEQGRVDSLGVARTGALGQPADTAVKDALLPDQGGKGSASSRARRFGNGLTKDANSRLLAPAKNADEKADKDVAGTNEARKPTIFQEFVLEATGNLLPVFGEEFFRAKSPDSRPVVVPSDYAVGPGDEVLVRIWGSVEIDHVGLVDRTGSVTIPQIGVIPVQGVPASRIEETVRAAVGKVFRNFQLSVSLGKLRGISVYVVGQALHPGSYALNSVSTLVDAVFQSGGPGPGGGVRNIQLIRGGRQAAELDLYTFLAEGRNQDNLRLLDGDVIMMPPANGQVALTGMVKNPAIYELKGRGKDTLRDLLDVAGGVPVLANPTRAWLERISPDKRFPRSAIELSLDSAGLAQPLRDGDLITVRPVVEEFGDVVTLRVSNDVVIRASFHKGMRLTDLIPSRDALLTPESVRRVNRQRPEGVVGRVGSGYEEINWEYASVERRDRVNLSVQVIPVELGRALDEPSGSANIPLQAGDEITVFSVDDIRVPLSRRRVLVRVEGEVKRPGIYQAKAGETLANLVLNAGGLTSEAYLFGAEFYRDSVRVQQQQNMDKLISRLEQQATSAAATAIGSSAALDAATAASQQTKLTAEREARKKFIDRLKELKPSGRVALPVDPETEGLAQLPAFRLEPGDRLVIAPRPDFVQLLGAVNTEAAMLWQSGRSVGDYLDQAGLSQDADRTGVFVLRANGAVISNNDRWLSSIMGSSVLPGDTIVVPEKSDREGFWASFTRGAKDWTQIFSNFGLGAAAIKSLKN